MKRRGTKELEQLKSLSLKIQNATKKCTITEKRGKQRARSVIYTSQGRLPKIVTPLIDFIDEPVI